MKLELKHLTPYLPYDLKVLVESDGFLQNDEIFIVNALTQDGLNVSTKSFPFNTDYCFEDFKPILRPLSDLSNEILSEFNFIQRPKENEDLDSLSYGFMKYCFENHFDIFGLIKNGLAIDKNTLKP